MQLDDLLQRIKVVTLLSTSVLLLPIVSFGLNIIILLQMVEDLLPRERVIVDNAASSVMLF